MILTLGVSLIFQSVARSPGSARFPRPEPHADLGPGLDVPAVSRRDAEVFVNQGQALSCFVALVLVAVIYQVFSRTSSASRCAPRADNPVCGDVRRDKGPIARIASLSRSAWRSRRVAGGSSRSTTRSSPMWACNS
jgi:hypothetical protein